MGIIAILSMSYITIRIVKKIDKCGKNLQSARRKPNYHTIYGKNCHKILSKYFQRPDKLTIVEKNFKGGEVIKNVHKTCFNDSLRR